MIGSCHAGAAVNQSGARLSPSTPRLRQMGLRTWLDVVDDVMLQRWHTRHLPSDPKDVCGPDVEGKTFIVTGPTSGIGTTTAETLARLGARVILACRTVKRGEALVERWTRDSEPGAPPLDCEVMHLDLDSLRSVRAFAEAFLATDRPLHCLLNNAGVFDMSGAYRKTQDGHEQHYGTNYLAARRCRSCSCPRCDAPGTLTRPAPARVIFVCSKLHEFCDGLALDDLAFERRRTARARRTRRASSRSSCSPGRWSGDCGEWRGKDTRRRVTVTRIRREKKRTPTRGVWSCTRATSSPAWCARCLVSCRRRTGSSWARFCSPPRKVRATAVRGDARGGSAGRRAGRTSPASSTASTPYAARHGTRRR